MRGESWPRTDSILGLYVKPSPMLMEGMVVGTVAEADRSERRMGESFGVFRGAEGNCLGLSVAKMPRPMEVLQRLGVVGSWLRITRLIVSSSSSER